ncbi:MAG: SPOR domain-containing protein [Deltaproteobacteria bacterium]|nr:SPOR domain-containing protein [Candidatus Zymogenaceae bacterium]
MALLNAVSKNIHLQAKESFFAEWAERRTAAVDGMPGNRRHIETRRFFHFTRSFLFLVSAFLLLSGCESDHTPSEKPEGHLVITDDEILLTLPRESTEEPYSTVSSAPIDENTFYDSLSDIGVENGVLSDDDSTLKDGDDGGVTTNESPDDRALFSLQVGAFIFDRNLEKQAEELEEHGFTHYVDETERVVLMFCPIVSRGLSRDGAESFMERFPTDVVDPVMIPMEKGAFDVTAGLFYYREDADVIAGRLKDFGYDPTIEERTVEVVIKRLRIGYYEEIEHAKSDSRLLEKLGYEPIIVKVEK